jgi:cold shock CspA family protein
MATIAAAPVQRSWSQVVEGDSKGQANVETIKPAARGSLLCSCRGEVISMSSNYGWLQVCGDVDHPSIEKHGGDVYIHKDDVVDDEHLYPGDVVNFYLYFDDKGLGAEWCSVEQRAESFAPPSGAMPQWNSKGFSFSATAHEFVPSYAAADEAASISKVNRMADVFFRLSLAFDSDDDDDDEDDFHLYKSWMASDASVTDGSTDEGMTSEDDSSDAASDSQDEMSPVDIADIINKVPPGKSLPTNFRTPPGLSLTQENGKPWWNWTT